MLHLQFALNLKTLASDMMNQIAKNWNDPFDAPTVIFSDYKLEGWFRLFWVEQKKVIANFNKKSLENFFLEILIGNDSRKKKLTSSILCQVIIGFLKQKTESKSNLDLLDENVFRYLKDKNGNLDELRLFDLANKLAGLFLEYEISRPSQFITNTPGILDCWKEGNLQTFFKDKNGNEILYEDWERTLYSAIFHNQNGESLLTKVFKEMKLHGNNSEYLTLPYLLETCKTENGNVKFHYHSNKPIFIFGLSGIGQFYHVLLREFAKEHEIYAYIQNPCTEFWEDLQTKQFRVCYDYKKDDEAEDSSEENILLQNLGRSGRDNIKIWSLANDYRGGFKEETLALYRKEQAEREKNTKKQNLLNELQQMVANRKNSFSASFSNSLESYKNESGSFFANDKSLSVASAETKLREIEHLHSEICLLLKQGAKIQDILVVAPDIESYRTSIYQVFDQNISETEEGVYLPFVLVDFAAKESNMSKALESIFQMCKKNSLTRPDFFDFVRNPLVMAVKNISEKDISVWNSFISNMNVYRDSSFENYKRTDWKDAIKRILLGKLSGDILEIDGEKILPYADINTSDEKSLNTFLEIIEELENLKTLLQTKIDESILEKFKAFITRFFYLEKPDENLKSEPLILETVLQALDDLKIQFYVGEKEISFEIFQKTLEEKTKSSEFSRGNLFVNGITFMKFAPNRIIPVKHLFFLGANAKDFPGNYSYDSLDLRKNVAKFPGDDLPADKNKYAFLCQLMSTEESFHLSYQRKYLPKDEDLYPSNIIQDLRTCIQTALKSAFKKEISIKNILPAYAIPLDETRKKQVLYTASAKRNKTILEKLKTDSTPEPRFQETQTNKENFKYPENVSVYQIKNFLENPFVFQMNSFMNFEEIKEDPEKILVEPIALNRLDESRYTKTILQEKLGIEIPENKKIKKENLMLKGIIPKNAYGDTIFESLDKIAENFKTSILEKFPESTHIIETQKINTSLETRTDTNENDFWNLSAEAKILAKNKNDYQEITLIDFKSKNEITPKDFLTNYILALSLLTKSEANKISLCLFYNEKNPTIAEIEIRETKEEAIRILNQIYAKMFIEKYKKLIPMDLDIKDIETFDAFQNKLKKSNYQYFKGKDLFKNAKTELFGFSGIDFKTELKNAEQEIWNLMPSIKTYKEQAEANKKTKKVKK